MPSSGRNPFCARCGQRRSHHVRVPKVDGPLTCTDGSGRIFREFVEETPAEARQAVQDAARSDSVLKRKGRAR